MSYTGGKWIHPSVKPTSKFFNGDGTISPQDSIAAINLTTTYSKGFTLPDHYLVPLTLAQINRRAELTAMKQWMLVQPGNRTPAKFITAVVTGILEFYNMAYVNNLVTWDYLQSAYKGASEDIAVIEGIEAGRGSLKEQLKKAVTVGVTMIAGLITGGPIGFFVGAASATAKIIANERARLLANAGAILNPMLQATAQAGQTRDEIEKQEKVTQYAGIGVGVLAIGGMLWAWLSGDK
jgi:hypothetical protein